MPIAQMGSAMQRSVTLGCLAARSLSTRRLLLSQP